MKMILHVDLLMEYIIDHYIISICHFRRINPVHVLSGS